MAHNKNEKFPLTIYEVCQSYSKNKSGTVFLTQSVHTPFANFAPRLDAHVIYLDSASRGGGYSPPH